MSVGCDAAFVERAEHPGLDRAEARPAREHEGHVAAAVAVPCLIGVADRRGSLRSAHRR